MGKNESKFKKAFEEMDSSGDEHVTFEELSNYFNPKREEIKALFEELTKEELAELYQEMINMQKGDIDNDGKFTYNEFKDTIKKNKTMKKFILENAENPEKDA